MTTKVIATVQEEEPKEQDSGVPGDPSDVAMVSLLHEISGFPPFWGQAEGK